MIFRRRNANAIVATAACLAVLWLSSSASAFELLGYWQLEETDFTQPAIDSSGNGLNGTYENGVNPNVPGAPGFGSGADFDGASVGGQILIGPGLATGLGTLINDFTVMAWINPDNFNHKNRVMGASPNAAWGWGTAGTNLQITTFGVKDYTQAVPIEANVWTHAAVAVDTNNDAHFYVNGVFVGTQTHPSPGRTSDNDFHIGWADGGGEHFDGQLDEVAVLSGVLTEEEILDAMLNGFGDRPPPGDVNGDFKVDNADFEIILANFFLSATEREQGDLVRDGLVDYDDFREWKDSPKGDFGPPPGAAAVPEPASIALLLSLAAVSVLLPRRISRTGLQRTVRQFS